MWVNILAERYGWTFDTISNLDTDVALALIQEILTDKQLEKEFLWGMSEIAYPYNSQTKESKFSPLQRPYWMKAAPQEIKMVRIRKSMLPVGNVQDVSGMESVFAKKQAESSQADN